jgi:hypothetical protein
MSEQAPRAAGTRAMAAAAIGLPVVSLVVTMLFGLIVIGWPIAIAGAIVAARFFQRLSVIAVLGLVLSVCAFFTPVVVGTFFGE